MLSHRWGLLVLGVIVFVSCGPRQPTPTPPTPQPEPKPSESERFVRELDAARSSRKDILIRHESFRKDLIRSFGFSEDPASCVAPPPLTEADIDVHKSLFVHDRATLGAADFSLSHTLGQLAAQAVTAGALGETAETLFVKLWDTQAPAPGVEPSAAHCDDDGGQVNGYPVSCRPSEAQQANSPATQMGRYHAVGLVNRFDLAHEGWRNCGEHRIVYGRSDGQRNFIIFEAVLPNPTPGCRSGCKPVAEFWASLSDPTMTDAARAAALHDFFYVGLPGFREVVHIDHYTAKGAGSSYGSSGSGQVRTNQFLQGPWLLKEFSLALDCGASPCVATVVPTMVKVNPFGTLWNQEVASDLASPFQVRATSFQGDFLSQVASLSGVDGGTCPAAGVDIGKMGYAVDPLFDAAESAQTGAAPDNYRSAFNPAGAVVAGLFRQQLAASPDLCGLTATQVVNRALSSSCAGCHEPGSFGLSAPGALGPVVTPAGPASAWPNSLGFVHTQETADATGIHALSPALLDVFLPLRRTFLVDQLNAETCNCVRKFGSLPGADRSRAIEIEKRIIEKFAPRIRQELDQLNRAKEAARAKKTIVSQKLVAASRARIAKLVIEREQQLIAELAKAQIQVESTVPDRRPQPLQLDAAKLARGDKKKEGELRRQAVRQLVSAEPPRRTVTGHFRVH